MATLELAALVPRTPREALRFVNDQIDEVERAQKRLDREYKCRSHENSKQLTKLVKTQKHLQAQIETDKAPPREGLDPHVQAGRHAPAMLEIFRRRRVATVAAAARLAGVPSSGSSTWAIKALLEDGAIEPTGKRVGRSAEYRYVAATKRKSKDTTLGPGQ